MTDWVTDYFAVVDAMDLQSFVDNHAEDAVVVFGNNPPAEGKAAISEAIGGFWSMIGGLRHDRRHLWFVDGGTAVLEASVHYWTKAGSEVVLPCVSLLDRRDALVTSLRVHIDLAPLFAEITTESGDPLPAR